MSLNQLIDPVKELNVKFNNVDLSTINNEPYPPTDDNKKITTLGSVGGNVEPAPNTQSVSISSNDVFVEQLKNTLIGSTEYTTTRVYCSQISLTTTAVLVVPQNVCVLKVNMPFKLVNSICKYSSGDLSGINNANGCVSASLSVDDTNTGYVNLGFITGDTTVPTATPLKISQVYTGNFDIHILTPIV